MRKYELFNFYLLNLFNKLLNQQDLFSKSILPLKCPISKDLEVVVKKIAVLHKKPLLGAVVGVILSLAATEAYRIVYPSTESRQLESAREEIADVRVQHETAKDERAKLEGQVSLLGEQLEQADEKAAKEREGHTNQLKRIDERLSPFVELAEQRYPNVPADDALERLRNELSSVNRRTTQLETEITVVREYADVAMLTFNGSQFSGGDISINSPLTTILEGTHTEVSPNQFRRVCTEESMGRYRQAIRDFPRFPFSYYWLALCLRESGDLQWKTNAESARAIFKQTTQIAGHQKSHDEALTYLRSLLD